MGFVGVLFGLAVLDRSAAGFFSTLFIVEPKVERRPIDALVGDVDRLGVGTDACLPVPEMDASSGALFLFVIELSEGLIPSQPSHSRVSV